MGFLDKMANEFGKKTGKALGNKLYGAHADDRRIGINRGKSNDSGLKVQLEVQQAEASMKKEQMEYEKNQKILDDVLNVDFDPTNKDGIIRGLTALSSYIDLWTKSGDCDEHLDAALSKYDSGLALLSAIDPSNPMNAYFIQKKTERTQTKKKNNIITIVVFVVAFIFLIIMALIFA